MSVGLVNHSFYFPSNFRKFDVFYIKGKFVITI